METIRRIFLPSFHCPLFNLRKHMAAFPPVPLDENICAPSKGQSCALLCTTALLSHSKNSLQHISPFPWLISSPLLLTGTHACRYISHLKSPLDLTSLTRLMFNFTFCLHGPWAHSFTDPPPWGFCPPPRPTKTALLNTIKTSMLLSTIINYSFSTSL